MSRLERLRHCLFAGLAFAGVEGLVALLAPAPGLPAEPWVALLELLIWGLVAALIGVLPRGELLLPLLIGAVVLPAADRILGSSTFVWLLLPLGALAVSRPRAAALAAVCLSLLPALLVARPRDGGGPSAAVRDRVLITVDTLRADHALALPGSWLVYEQALASAPWTLPAMDSVMTGLPVRRHLGGLPVDGGYSRPDPSLPLLAERLQDAGLHTAAFVSNPHLRAELGFARGFDSFVHSDHFVDPFVGVDGVSWWWRSLRGGVSRLAHRRDELLVDAALQWWQETPRGGRFLWVHLLLPHEYGRDPHGRPLVAEPDDDWLRAAYAENVDAAGRQVGRLVDGLGSEALVVVTSDHGESLGEEQRWGHGSALVDEQLQVPVLLRGVEEGRRSRQVAAWEVHALLTGEVQELAWKPVLELGGLRRDASAFAARGPGGLPLERSAPTLPEQGMQLDPSLREALEALGYVDR